MSGTSDFVLREFKMRLPEDWNKELNDLETKISELDKVNNTFYKKVKKVIANAHAEYQSKMTDTMPFHSKKKKAWAKIRKKYNITHPTRKKSFKYYDEAAAVLAHYWQGKEMPREELVKCIGGGGSQNLYPEAHRYAKNLTEPGSPEQYYVQKASDFLWKDYTR